MEYWSDQVNNSPALLNATEIRRLLSDVNFADFSIDDQRYLERAQVVVEVVLNRIENSDPRLINPSALTSIGTSLSNIVSHLGTWNQGANPAYLTTHIQTELDSTLSQSILLTPSLDVPGAREAITSLRRTVARHRTIVDGLVDDIRKKGSLADESIDEKVVAASEEFDKLQLAIVSLGDGLSDLKTASIQVTTEQQTAFTKAEADRSAIFNKLVSEKQKELEASLEVLKSKTGEEVKAIHEIIKADESSISAAKLRVEGILGIVGEEALIGDYSNNAKNELSTADLWRWIASGSIVMAIAIAVWFSTSISDTTSWQHVVGKVVIISSFGGLAGYAAKQSSEHRIAQRNAEQMALQLKAIKPYLGDIDDVPKRDELLIRIADRLFGQIQKITKKGKKGDNPALTAQLMEAVVELIRRDKSS